MRDNRRCWHVAADRRVGISIGVGISIAPGPIFSPTRRFKNCIRLNYGSPWSEASERAMETLGKIVRSMLP